MELMKTNNMSVNHVDINVKPVKISPESVNIVKILELQLPNVLVQLDIMTTVSMLNVSNVPLNVNHVSLTPSTVPSVTNPELKMLQIAHVHQDLLKSSDNVNLVIGDVTLVKPLQEIVPHVKLTELKNQPVCAQKELMKSSDKPNVQLVTKSVSNVSILPPTV